MKKLAVLCVTFLVCAWSADGAPVTSVKSPSPGVTDAITIPLLLSYQGRLLDSAGGPVPDGIYAVTFSMYAESTGGAAFWTELQNVQTRTGLFNVQMGAVTPLASLPEAGNCWLEMQVHPDPVMIPRIRIVSAAYACLARKADTANYALAGGTQNVWVRGTPDSVLYTIHRLGIARGGADNMLLGTNRFTHVNLGVACTTGSSGQNRTCATVGGGQRNTAWGDYATIGGGDGNAASSHAAVGGGMGNAATGVYATVGGGAGNLASGNYATVGGGSGNAASSDDATVGGGSENSASGIRATVGGGYRDTAAASYSFAVGNRSVAASGFNNSAAFNGQTTTASNQLRCGALSKTGGSFTIDHPTDPYGKILNHYFVESPDMSNLYSGSVVLDAGGRAEVRLPDYFDALNRNPRIQLTGVGSPDVVYVVTKVHDNRFVIGGKPGAEVYWQVTGDRKDQSAEVIRTMMPVEQPKTRELAGRMLDDDFLVGCMLQLERMGLGGSFRFRTAAAQRRYEDMKRILTENKE